MIRLCSLGHSNAQHILPIRCRIAVGILISLRHLLPEQVVRPFSVEDNTIQLVRVAVQIFIDILIVEHAGKISQDVQRNIAGQQIALVLAHGDRVHIVHIPPGL